MIHKPKTTVIYGADANYTPQALISIWSMQKFMKKKQRPMTLLYISEPITDSQLEFAKQLRKALGISFYIMIIKQEHLPVSRNPERFPPISLLPLVIPSTTENKVLYIDADTLIRDNITPLLREPLNGLPLGACHDIAQGRISSDYKIMGRWKDAIYYEFSRKRWAANMYRVAKLGTRIMYENYFNSGVMLMDCKKIKELERLGMGILKDSESLQQFKDSPDNDRLVQFFQGMYKQLPLKWNVTPNINKYAHDHDYYKLASASMRKQMIDAANDPKIWHYIGSKKPWHRWSFAHTKKAFVEYSKAVNEICKTSGITKHQLWNLCQ